ncbi:probable L-type lectin-domain containing receptor kinase S.7 [Beta vulgaris subsp. vulgaris]|uniref:probable L-type lectin-domain containing receptor kinase S.7 n=1 Tax=Beta vulgaris subsp. vulgaris TaxID=3555 RepID=UPI0020371BD0|nr:probable L-type lectin-domain containing receptor kinase S.7 [Beta vulgaris subsp. vulgaris]
MSCTAFFRRFLVWLALVLVLRVVLGGEDGLKSTHMITMTKSHSFPKFSTSINPRIEHDIKLLGSAKLSSDKQSIQIPDISELDDLRHQAGRAIYSSPIRVFDPNSQTPASFETTFSFQLNNHTSPLPSNSTSEEAHGGSGLTFLIAPDEFTVGRPGPWLGMLNDACNDNYKFIAVEFDTRQNPEYGDPNDNHIGINLGSIVSKSTINASDYGLSFEDGSIHLARITYDGSTQRMEIWVESNPKTPLRSVFSDDIDLTPFLNEYMFVGFSASTGNKTQIHNILSWNFTFTTPAFLRYPTSETCDSKILVGKNRVSENNKVPIKKERSSTPFLIFICVVVLCFLIFINLYFNGKKAKKSYVGSAFMFMPEKKLRPTPPNKARRFTRSELSLATRGFSDLEVIGSDSSGVLYRGTLPNGCHVAVKRFLSQFLGSLSMDRRKFLKRVVSLSRVRHPSLVPIRGWCYETRVYMVVYEYMFNGCVDKWLFGVGVLPWSRRFKVVKNVANGLSHLHSRQIAHNNVQVSSVFLDVSFKAVLGDFGLSDPFGIDSTSSRSVDVFNFGILVLEVVSGRKRWVAEKLETDSRGSGSSQSELAMDEMDLLDYAWIMHERGEKIKMVDRLMGSIVDTNQALRVIDIALLCTLPENNGRPKMEEIVTFLTMDCILPELPPNRPIVLFPYNSGPHLCGGYVCAPFG